MRNRVLIYGAGQEAQSVYYILRQQNYKNKYEVVGFKDDNRKVFDLLGLPVRKSLAAFDYDNFILAITNKAETNLHDLAALSEYVVTPIKVIDRRAHIHTSAILMEAVVVHRNASVDAEAFLADFVIIKASASIGRSAVISEYTTVGRHCVVGDGVKIKRGCVIEDRASIKQGLTLGNRVVLTSGSVLAQDAKSDSIYSGIPAERVGRSRK